MVSDIADDELEQAEVGRNPAVALPKSGADFTGAIGGKARQDGPIFNAQEKEWVPGRPITNQQQGC